jgi:hypothetical protein
MIEVGHLNMRAVVIAETAPHRCHCRWLPRRDADSASSALPCGSKSWVAGKLIILIADHHGDLDARAGGAACATGKRSLLPPSVAQDLPRE